MAAAPTVSACLITKNEAGNLPACLTSLSGHVDEIVVVDTGSTDDTVATARRAGARILHHPWDDDFSMPRNRGLDAASSDWILYIDADERLSTRDGAPLSTILPGDDASAARILLRPKPDYTPYTELRLFRNDPRIRFEGIMHERITPSLRAVRASDGARISTLRAVALDHVGYEGDQAHKHARNEPLLRKALRRDPDRAYCWFHLATTLQATGRADEALSCARTALDLACRSADPDERSVGSSCCQILAETALAAGRPAKAVQHAEQGLRLCPDNHALVWVLARSKLAAGAAQAAFEIARPLLDIDPDSCVHETLSFERMLFRRDAHALLAACCFDLGRFDAADRHYELAGIHGADPLEIRVKRALCRSAGKQVGTVPIG